MNWLRPSTTETPVSESSPRPSSIAGRRAQNVPKVNRQILGLHSRALRLGESPFDQLSRHECHPSGVIFVGAKFIFAHGPPLDSLS